MKIKAKLGGLCCAHCAAKIEEKISKLEGVQSASVSILTEKMIIIADDARVEEIKAEAEKIAHKIEPDVKVEYI